MNEVFSIVEPDNVLGAPLPLTVILHERPGELLIALSGFTAYPSGFGFSLALRRRADDDDRGWWDMFGREAGEFEHVRQPVAALLAGREELDKRIRMRGNPPERMDPTTQHDDDEWCTSRRERLDQLRLEAAQFQARGVVPFTYRNRSVQPALAGQHQDCDLGVAGGLHRVGKARPIIAEHLASSGVQDLDVVAQDGAQACARCDVRSEVRAGRIGAVGSGRSDEPSSDRKSCRGFTSSRRSSTGAGRSLSSRPLGCVPNTPGPTPRLPTKQVSLATTAHRPPPARPT